MCAFPPPRKPKSQNIQNKYPKTTLNTFAFPPPNAKSKNNGKQAIASAMFIGCFMNCHFVCRLWKQTINLVTYSAINTIVQINSSVNHPLSYSLRPGSVSRTKPRIEAMMKEWRTKWIKRASLPLSGRSNIRATWKVHLGFFLSFFSGGDVEMK